MPPVFKRFFIVLPLLLALIAAPISFAVQEQQGDEGASLAGCNGVRFSEAVGSPVDVGVNPTSPVVADFNLDGRPDLAIANENSHNVTILLNKGGERFVQSPGSPVGVYASSCPNSVAVGDFNVDGKPDLAVVGNCINSVNILLGDGVGGFSEAPGSPFRVGTPRGRVAVGDFNLDGKPDLALTNTFSNSITILLGNGMGGFTEAPGSPVGAELPGDIAVGDFNSEGKPDLAVVNGGFSNLSMNSVSILLGNGSGGFTGGSSILVEAGSASMAVGDFNLDGKLDLAVANDESFSGSVTILLGNGDGRFTQAIGSPIRLKDRPTHSVVVGDFDLDGKPDLAVSTSQSNGVTVLLGNGAGGFIQSAGSPVSLGLFPRSLAVADFNQDGKPDFVVVNGISVTIQLNTCTPIPDFALSFEQPTVTAEMGSKVSVTLSIARNSGLTGNVTIKAPETLPNGIVVGLDPVTATTGDRLSFKIKVKMRALPGTYPLVFTGVDDSGKLTRAATLTLVVR